MVVRASSVAFLPKKTAADRQYGGSVADAKITKTNNPRFVTDAMLGKLTKWLRALGLDVVYAPDMTDAQLLQYARHAERILLTRDRRLARRRSLARRLLITSDYYDEQVRQVVQIFRLEGAIQIFTRCIRCNTPLRTIAKPLVLWRVPPYVHATQMIFKHCTTCDRVYWGGTHRDNMLRQLKAMLGSMSPIIAELSC